MANKSRVPLQVSQNFAQKLKELQKIIRMKTGNEISLREITDDIVKTQAFKDIEKNLLANDIEMDIKIRMDGRRL